MSTQKVVGMAPYRYETTKINQQPYILTGTDMIEVKKNSGHLEFQRQRNYRKATLRTFRIVGTPILLTSLVISANFAMYMTSNGLTIIHMGILSVAGVLTALLADLCITPLLFRRFRIFGKEEN